MRALTDKQLILQGDMRTFKHHIEYDSIFIGFNSFLHLLDERNAKRCLSNIKQHLHKSSIVYIDMFVPQKRYQQKPHSQPWCTPGCAFSIAHRNHHFHC